MMHGTGFGMGFGGFGLGWVFMIIFWGVIILVAVYLIKAVFTDKKSDGTGKDSETAEDILKRRLASGEISNEEYEEKLKVLRGSFKKT